MLSKRDLERKRPSGAAPDTLLTSMSLLESPPRTPFDLFGPKSDARANQFEPRTNGEETTSTRQASVVAAPEEQDEDWDVPLTLEATTHGSGHVIKRRNVGVPKFLRFLFQILQVEDPAIITWSHEGTAFQIIQPDELANQILPKYFKHNKVSSFQRQLNYFGFKKWTKTQTNVCTFSHPFFVRADKDRMKLIKRKERANAAVMSAAMAATSQSNPMDLMNHVQVQENARALAGGCLEVPVRGQMPTQQALKRQKSNTLSGATVTFLNSAAAGRRHSTGMLPGSDALGLAAAAAASADSFVPGSKRAGTPAEQEFELEMEARSGSAVNSTSVQQQIAHMRRIAEAMESPQRYPYLPAHGKRQSLPHVLPPGFGDIFGTSMNVNATVGVANGGFGPRSANILGRRKSDQLLSDYNNIGGASGNKLVSIRQIEDFMASSSTSASQQTTFGSTIKNDASAVLPVSSNSVHNAHQLQQQRQLRQQVNRQQHFGGGGYEYGVKPQSSSGWPSSVKSESSSGWSTSVNANISSIGNTSYQSQPMMMPLKFGGSNTPQSTNPSFQGNGSMDFSHTASGDDRKLQQRPLTSYPQQYQSHQGQVASYQHQQQKGQQEQDERRQTTQQPRDYIDVLLESAGVDDTLTPQSSTMLSSESWNGHSENDPNTSGSTESFAFMQTQQQLQLSPMRNMPHNPIQRF